VNGIIPARRLLLVTGLSALVLAAYAICLRFPFVQDDWSWMSRFQSGHPGEILKSICVIKGNLFFGPLAKPYLYFFRPLSRLYIYAMYLVFGANPFPFHVAALMTLVANSLLIIAILEVITRDKVVSIAAGFVYAAGAAVHLESLLWAVGIYDLDGSLLFLLAMLLFLKGRPVWSAGAFLAGCLFKETVVVLPFILAAYAFLGRPGSERASTKRSFKDLAPIAIALCAAACILIAATAPFNLPQYHPYAVAFHGRSIMHNLYSYAAWMVQCFDPLLATRGMAIKLILGALLVVFLVSARLASRIARDETATDNPRRAAEPGALWFLASWLCLALVPCIFLPNHVYRYYAIFALPAFIGMVFLQLRILCESARCRRGTGGTILAVVAGGAAILSLLEANILLREGLAQRTLADGTNQLIRRAATVQIVRENLMAALPAPPKGVTIILGDVDLAAFDGASGPRVWYHDGSIDVFPLDYLMHGGGATYVLVPRESGGRGYSSARRDRIDLDPAKIFAYRLVGAELRPAQP